MNVLWLLSRLDGFVLGQAGSAVLAAITLIILVCLIVQRCAKNLLWTTSVCDAGVLAFAAAQIVSTYFGIYHENSLIYGVGVANAANIYFIFRCSGGLSSKPFQIFAVAVCIVGVSLALVNIPATVERFMEWRRLGLSDVISFRASFFLAGGGTKTDSLNLALASLPFSLVVFISERTRLYHVIAICSFVGAIAVIVIGMSRGVYLGLFSLCAIVLLIARTHGIKLKREARTVLLATSVVMLATTCIYTLSVKQMGNVAGRAATSETRSVDGRLRIWCGTLSHIHDYGLSGVGGGNGALYTLRHVEASPYEPFTARTYNWMLEVLLQNGVIGLIVFCVIVVGTYFVGLGVVRSFDGDPLVKQAVVFALGGMTAILISDLTYTSVVRHPPVMCLFFALAGAVSGVPRRHMPERRGNRLTTTASLGVVALFLPTSIYFTVCGIKRMYSESEYARASIAMQQGDYENALRHLAVAENHSDCDALYASMEGLVLERSADEGQQFSDSWLRKGIISPQRRAQALRAVGAYQRALTCAPMDAALHNNLGWLYAMLGDQEQARRLVAEAMRIEPNTAIYHLSSGLLFERDGYLDAAYYEYSEAIARSPRIVDSEFFVQLREDMGPRLRRS